MTKINEMHVAMDSDPWSVRDGLRRAMGQDPLASLSPDDRGTAEIVLAEVLNNIVEHAYARFPGTIRLRLTLGPGQLHCCVEDEGLAMPSGEPPSGKAVDPQDLPEGGFGWHLIRTLSSGLTYERAGTLNQLRFALPAEQSAG